MSIILRRDVDFSFLILYNIVNYQKEQKQIPMRTKEDARVIKTKSKLFQSFKSLLAEKPYEEITVNELCNRAEIRRATFYKHFTDKYDFLIAMVGTYIRSFDKSMKNSEYKNYPVEYHIEYQRKLVAYLTDNEDIVKLIFTSNMYPHLLTAIVQQSYIVVKERLERSVSNGEQLIAPVDIVATVLAGGIGSVIVKWFEENKPCSVDDLHIQLEAFFRAMFKK